MRQRTKIVGLVIGLTALTLGLIVYNLGHFFAYICEGKDEIAVVRLNNELVVKITAEKCWENARPIFYEVADRGKTMVPTTYLSSEEPEDIKRFKLKALSNEDGTVYGVVEEKLPQKVWLLYSVNGDTWPRCETGGYDFCEERGDALLRELQKAHPEIAPLFSQLLIREPEMRRRLTPALQPTANSVAFMRET